MKLYINSAISEGKSRYMCMGVNNFYLNNQMDNDKYITIQILMIPQEFVEKCNLTEKSHNGYIYARVTKGMYRLPQSGRIAHDALLKHLDPYGYYPSRKNPYYGNTTVNQ